MRVHHSLRFDREDVQDLLFRFADGVADIYPCGSYRRELPTLGDLDLVVVGEVDADKLYHSTQAVDLYVGKRIHLVHVIRGLRFQTEIALAKRENLGAHLLRWTGSKEWLAGLRSLATQRGWRLTEEGLFERDRLIHAETERGILDALDVGWVEPERREL